ncbi:putative cGMP-dependent 3 [Penaeus vannamei]|uniref:Putative cGMP-dependent 3 n=1 Tax=Penaeus vannamei TaxID=6689 RepID=A0A423TUD3_PENVA|nr:putative cGMP-dependent 3 [Penaeus vannamei]
MNHQTEQPGNSCRQRDPGKLLELCASLADQDGVGIQIKLNRYLAVACEADLAFLILVSDDEEELTVHVLGDTLLPSPIKIPSGGEVRLPLSQGIAGHVATTGRLLNIKDAYAHPLFYKGFDECTGFKTRNILCFPIKEDGEVLGVAELCNKTTGLHFTRFDEELATAFSIYCGISISNSLLYKKVFDTQVRSKLSNELMMFHMKTPREIEGPPSRRPNTHTRFVSDELLGALLSRRISPQVPKFDK